MTTDILSNLMNSDPNEPATRGELMLMRAETKSEFRTMGSRIDRVEQRLGVLEKDVGEMKVTIKQIQTTLDQVIGSINMIAEQVSVLVSRSS